jgi:hypothetical protein
VLPHKDHQSNVANPADPGVADQLRIKRQQPRRFLGVATSRRLPRTILS